MIRSGWFKSSHSNKNGCVEVRVDHDTVYIRDSKYIGTPASQPVIAIPTAVWFGFLAAAADSATAAPPGAPTLSRSPDGGVTLRADNGTTLTYTPIEWNAFTSGIRAGEFSPV